MDKAGSEGKPWISGLYEYRVIPQSVSIASPLQLITQCTPREKDLPQLPSTLGAQEMYETHQELIRRQQNKPEKNYIELTPGMPVWVQHRQNTSWEPATVMSQCTSNSYWIMQENGTDQPKVYRRTRTMLKIRCTNIRQTRHSNSQLTESEKTEFHTPEREEIAEIADVPAPTPAPAPALERIKEQSTYTPGSRKSTRKNFGKPASSFSDFTCK